MGFVLELNKRQRITADFSLLMVALIWGLTFSTVKIAIADMAPFTFVAIRFAIAFIFMVLFCWKKLFQFRRSDWLPGIFVGIFLFGGYSFQTIGLQFTTVSNAGFITGLSVVMVPLFYSILKRSFPSPLVLVGAALAGCGIGLLCLNEGYTYNFGDILVLACAVSFALHIIAIGRYASQVDATVGQHSDRDGCHIECCGGFCFEPNTPIQLKEVWIGLLTTAIPATSLAFSSRSYMKIYYSYAYCNHIIHGAGFLPDCSGYLLLNEVLGARGLWGGLVPAGDLCQK